MGNKQDENNCLMKTVDYVNNKASKMSKKYFISILPVKNISVEDFVASERPDFVLKSAEQCYGIEHFMVDFCYDGINNNQSQSRLLRKRLWEIYNKFHDEKEGLKNEDVESARQEIEEFINHNTNISNDFDYSKYIEGLKKTFDKHYKRINDYIHNCSNNIDFDNVKIGFLIEFHCDTFLLYALLNGVKVYFNNSQNMQFPLTKDIINIFKSANKLDFIILTQFSEGVESEANSVLMFEPNNMNKSIDKQRVKIYDQIDYCKVEKVLDLLIQ